MLLMREVRSAAQGDNGAGLTAGNGAFGKNGGGVRGLAGRWVVRCA